MAAKKFILGIVLALAGVSGALRQNVVVAGEVKTSKERLSDKAADNQRVDNCRVPLERRGPIARPGCAAETASDLPAAGQRDKAMRGSR